MDILNKIKSIFSNEEVTEEVNEDSFVDVKTKDGEKILRVSELAEGGKVQIIQEDGELIDAPAGKHELEDGTIVELDEEASIISIEKPQEMEDKSEEKMSEGASAYIELPVGEHMIGDKKYVVVEKLEDEGTENERMVNYISEIIPVSSQEEMSEHGDIAKKIDVVLDLLGATDNGALNEDAKAEIIGILEGIKAEYKPEEGEEAEVSEEEMSEEVVDDSESKTAEVEAEESTEEKETKEDETTEEASNKEETEATTEESVEGDKEETDPINERISSLESKLEKAMTVIAEQIEALNDAKTEVEEENKTVKEEMAKLKKENEELKDEPATSGNNFKKITDKEETSAVKKGTFSDVIRELRNK